MITNFQTHAANERTFLAWVRTAIAIEGFGVGAARLGSEPAPLWSELLMLGCGALVIALAWLRNRHLRKRIDSDQLLDDDSAVADILLVLLVTALFALLAVFAIHVA